MDLNHLAIFIQVIESGSISKAALKLRMQKSKISRSIKSLEHEVGATLIYRNTRQLSLTDSGKSLYQKSIKHINELEKIGHSIKKNFNDQVASIRITSTDDMASYIISPLVSEFLKNKPDVNIELLATNQFVDLIKDGVDLALRVGKLNDSELKSQAIGKLTFIIVASPNYVKKLSAPKKVNQLSSHQVLWFSVADDEERWKLFESKSKKEKNIEVTVKHRSNNPKFLLDLTLNGEGIALLPEFLCIDYLQDGRLVRILDDYETEARPVQFIWPSQEESHPVIKEFIKFSLPKLQKYFPK